MKYRIIDHTADVGLHVFGADPSELFATAARAMFHGAARRFMAESNMVCSSPRARISASVKGMSRPMRVWVRSSMPVSRMPMRS